MIIFQAVSKNVYNESYGITSLEPYLANGVKISQLSV